MGPGGFIELAMLLGGAIGALFFLWIAGTRVLDPREIGWTMRLDWQQHYLGWHLFRNEPWRWPPGAITGEFYPIGTSIAYTDSVPIVAFLLKPFSALLPVDFQYLGIWLLICFTLQGACGALLLGCWTRSAPARVLGAALLVISPILLNRIGHIALCSHWLLLLALWLYFKRWSHRVWPRVVGWSMLAATAALVNPYLWLMTIVIAAAAAWRDWLDREGAPTRHALAHLPAIALVSLIVAWLEGWFILGARELAGAGLGVFSMNLLAPFASEGISALLPTLTMFPDQRFEGFNYLGAGVLALMMVAAAALLWRLPGRATWRRVLPLLTACALLTMFALSPRVTFGERVLLDIQLPEGILIALSTFRASARFFWPVWYVAVVSAVAVIATRLRGFGTLVLLAAVLLQAFDIHARFDTIRAGSSDPAFYAWSRPDAAPWPSGASSLRHLVVSPALFCGPEPAPYSSLMYLAGIHRLTINTGSAGRFDLDGIRRGCGAVSEQLASGRLDADTLYIIAADRVDELRAKAPVDCRPLMSAYGCVSTRPR